MRNAERHPEPVAGGYHDQPHADSGGAEETLSDQQRLGDGDVSDDDPSPFLFDNDQRDGIRTP